MVCLKFLFWAHFYFIFFNIYMLTLDNLIQSFNVSYKFYAHDTQIFLTLVWLANITNCLTAIKAWTSTNVLKLSAEKTKLLFMGSDEMSDKVQPAIDSAYLKTKPFVINLGLTTDF